MGSGRHTGEMADGCGCGHAHAPHTAEEWHRLARQRRTLEEMKAGAQRLQALRQRQAAANPAPAASAGQAGPAAVAAQEALWREEAVRTFCVERRAR